MNGATVRVGALAKQSPLLRLLIFLNASLHFKPPAATVQCLRLLEKQYQYFICSLPLALGF